MSSLNTSGSSLTEEVFNAALSNLEFLSDEEAGIETFSNKERKSSHATSNNDSTCINDVLSNHSGKSLNKDA